jgi:hypothetical protein
VSIFQHLQKTRHQAGVFQEPMNRLKAHHLIIAVEQNRDPQRSHHERVTMQDRDGLTPFAVRVVWEQQQVV